MEMNRTWGGLKNIQERKPQPHLGFKTQVTGYRVADSPLMGFLQALYQINQMVGGQGVGHLMILGRGPDPVSVPRNDHLGALVQISPQDPLGAGGRPAR